MSSGADYLASLIVGRVYSQETIPDGHGATERDAAGQMTVHLCDPDCHGPSHEEYLVLSGRAEESGRH